MKRGVAALISVAAIAATLVAAVTLIGQQLAVPTELRSAPPTPEDKRAKQGARAVLSLHARDANFPTLNREGNLRSAARTGGKAKGVYPRRFR